MHTLPCLGLLFKTPMGHITKGCPAPRRGLWIETTLLLCPLSCCPFHMWSHFWSYSASLLRCWERCSNGPLKDQLGAWRQSAPPRVPTKQHSKPLCCFPFFSKAHKGNQCFPNNDCSLPEQEAGWITPVISAKSSGLRERTFCSIRSVHVNQRVLQKMMSKVVLRPPGTLKVL